MKTVLFICSFYILFYKSYCQENCRIEIECEDCLPDYLPTITSHKAYEDIIIIAHGDEVQLQCHRAKFINYPEENFINGSCEDGLFRIQNETRHLSDLGCLSDYFEDVSHQMNYCSDPLQGRSYQYHNLNLSTTLHISEICYDVENRIPVFAHMTMSNGNNIIQNNNHIDDLNKMSMFGNINKMLDTSYKIESEKLFESNQGINKKMKTLIGKHKFSFIDQSLTISKLLPAAYYNDQNGRINKFVSNKIALWNSVAMGNYKNLQNDIIYGFKRTESNELIDVYSGTLGTLAIETENELKEVYLKPGRKYPVPKYVWTLVINKSQNKAVALVLLNNPFVSVSEIKSSVFCPSVCTSISWVNNLLRSSNYERSAYGLLFCCDIHSFLARGLSQHSNNFIEITRYIPQGAKGILRDPLP